MKNNKPSSEQAQQGRPMKRTREELLNFAQSYGATLSDAAGTVNFEPFELERFVDALVSRPAASPTVDK